MQKIYSTDCIAEDFTSKWYKKWSSEIGYPQGKHPKFWETAAIAEMLHGDGHLAIGKSGLGMGVGTEPLASLFAKYGVNITATDQDPNAEKSDKWDNGQLAHGKESLYYPAIIDKKVFNKLVKYESYDMNAENKSYFNKFDFVWHNCVIGHLGTMENSIAQLKRSEKYLKKGGSLVFTTELNISNFDSTILDNSDTIVWRLTDIERLFKEMADVGMIADRLRLRLGNSIHDTRINYNHIKNIHQSSTILLEDENYSEIKIPFANYAITQVILHFRKIGDKSAKLIKQYESDTVINTAIIKKHLLNNKDLRDYHDMPEDIEFYDAELTPEQKNIDIEMYAGTEGKIDLRFLNRSNIRLYDFSPVLPFGRPPLVLGTYNPVNRVSKFKTDDWASPNRPTVIFALHKMESTPEWNEHRADPDKWFTFSFPIKAPKKPGKYTESFCLIFEGKAVPLSSVVTITITVKTKKGHKKDNSVLSVSQYFKVSGLSKIFTKKVQTDFENWLKIASKKEFRYRYCISTPEFTTLLESYLNEYHPNYKYNKDKLYLIGKGRGKLIQINPLSMVRSPKARIVYQISNPRVGGTLFNEIIGDLTGWPSFNRGTVRYAFDYNCPSTPVILHMHETFDNFQKRLDVPLEYNVITLARNPIDTLISGFMFAQKNPILEWMDDKVFPDKKYWEGGDLGPDSDEFFNWATSEASKNMLIVSQSWWDKADARVKYEDYKQNPVEVIGDILEIIDPENAYSAEQIMNTVNKLDKNFLVNTTNRHRWNGGINYADKYIPADRLEAIRQYHMDSTRALGY